MTKAVLLLIARQVADDLALRVHLALDALRAAPAARAMRQTLTQVMLLTGFLAESGFGSATGEQLGAAESAVSAVFDAGRETGEWRLDSAGFALFAEIASNYDRQLNSAPLWAITDANQTTRSLLPQAHVVSDADAETGLAGSDNYEQAAPAWDCDVV